LSVTLFIDDTGFLLKVG